MRARNLVLAALPERQLGKLQPELIPIAARRVLASAGSPLDAVWLPETSVIAYEISMSDGRAVAAAFVGYHGFGAPPILGSPFGDEGTFVCLIAGDAWRVAGAPWADLLTTDDQFCAATTTAIRWGGRQIMQLGACARIHLLHRRLATVLLLLADKADRSELSLTHEDLASVLGAQRPSVSLLLHRYSLSGLINTARGGLTIVDRRRLETWACECYAEITRPLHPYPVAQPLAQQAQIQASPLPG